MPIKNLINRESKGFLDLFRAKVGGQGPKDLREDCQPIIDLKPFLGSAMLRGANATATGNPPANLNIAIPDAESWVLYRVVLSIYSSTVAAVFEGAAWSLQLQGLVDSSGAVTDLDLGVSSFSNTANSSIAFGGNAVWSPDGSIMIPGGCNLQGQLLVDDTANNYLVDLSVVYVPLQH